MVVAGCNAPQCNPNTTSCHILDDEVNEWTNPLFARMLFSE